MALRDFVIDLMEDLLHDEELALREQDLRFYDKGTTAETGKVLPVVKRDIRASAASSLFLLNQFGDYETISEYRKGPGQGGLPAGGRYGAGEYHAAPAAGAS